MKEDTDCLFCSIEASRIVEENRHAYAVRDHFPVTALHTLVIPKRHVKDYFGLTEEELLACNALLNSQKIAIHESDNLVEGFNIGMNAGLVAGQTIFHCHIHLIPRRQGDVDNPRGGVRHTIPGKGNY